MSEPETIFLDDYRSLVTVSGGGWPKRAWVPKADYLRLEDELCARLKAMEDQRSVLLVEHAKACSQIAAQELPDQLLDVHAICDERDRLRALARKMADTLCNCAQILDVVKIEWGESWSVWDQSVRDDITACLRAFHSKLPTETDLVGSVSGKES